MFLLVPAYPGCPGSKAVKRSLLLLLYTACPSWHPTKSVKKVKGKCSNTDDVNNYKYNKYRPQRMQCCLWYYAFSINAVLSKLLQI